MRIKRFIGAFFISFALLTIVMFVVQNRLDNQKVQTLKDIVGVETFSVPEVPKAKARKPIVKREVHRYKDVVGVETFEAPDPPKPKMRKPIAKHLMSTRNAPLPPVDTHVDLPISNSLVALADMRPSVNAPVQALRLQATAAPALKALQLNPPNGAAFDDVFYKNHGTNPFIDTEDDNFSTFGMDVDTASYSVMRRYLRDGILPPSDAVRVEEFVNAFDYNYTPPTEDVFAVYIEGAPSKFGEGKRIQLLHIGIQGRVIPDTDRKDAILTFVIDVSGSMNMENRLGLVKRSLTLLVDQLRPADKVGIVVYGSNARVVLPHTSIKNREYILEAINSLVPDGATNAEEGLRVGYKLALKNSKSDCINRVILCSDGVANVGQTGPDAILKKISNYVKEGVTLTTVGFGMGNYNDVLMEQLANKGNGSYAYVDTIKEAKRVFVENLTGTLQVIAKDAKIQVEFNPKTVSRFRLLGYENRALAHEDFRKDDVDAGEVGSGHSVTALYEIKLHENTDGKLATVFIRHENPDTQRVTEVSETIATHQLKQSFEVASSEFQLVAGVAEFAEILRESFWAKGSSLAAVQETIEGVLPHIHSKTPEHKQRKEELLNLVREARRLEKQKEGYTISQ